jgi:hypothetical protein
LQVAARQQLHHIVRTLEVDAELMDANNPRMSDLRERVKLSLEQLQIALVLEGVRLLLQPLERDPLLIATVSGLVHEGHTPAADQSVNHVAAIACAGDR